MNENTATGIPYPGIEMLAAPLTIGKAVFEMTMLSTISFAKMVQIAIQSTDTALEKYIELTQEQLNKVQRKETIMVE
jgi:hypothetical protein